MANMPKLTPAQIRAIKNSPKGALPSFIKEAGKRGALMDKASGVLFGYGSRNSYRKATPRKPAQRKSDQKHVEY